MRYFLGSLVCGALLACTAASANAASMEIRLVGTPADGTGLSGLWNVDIQVRANGSAEGIKGLQFDILSQGEGLTAPVGTGPGGVNAKITWSPTNIVGSFGTVSPSNKDATVQPPGFTPVYPADPDSDKDALGASFSDSGNAFTKSDLGVGAFATVATEQWQMTNSGAQDFLNVYVLGAQYYDFTNGQSPSFAFDYTPANITVTGTVVGVPEPGTLLLAALSIPALAYAIRRRKVA